MMWIRRHWALCIAAAVAVLAIVWMVSAMRTPEPSPRAHQDQARERVIDAAGAARAMATAALEDAQTAERAISEADIDLAEEVRAMGPRLPPTDERIPIPIPGIDL